MQLTSAASQHKEGMYPFNLTEPEILFLKLKENPIRENLKEKDPQPFHLSSRSQSDFQKFVHTKLTSSSFTEDELKLKIIIPSLWEKSKIHLEEQLKKSKNKGALANERRLQHEALTKSYITFSVVSRYFTVRQMGLLLSIFTSGSA